MNWAYWNLSCKYSSRNIGVLFFVADGSIGRFVISIFLQKKKFDVSIVGGGYVIFLKNSRKKMRYQILQFYIVSNIYLIFQNKSKDS